MQGEEIVRVTYNVQGQIGLAGMPRLYDLVITDRRIVGIMKKNLAGAQALGASFGAVGGAVAGKSVADAMKQMHEYEAGELDNLVAQEKTSFSLAWDSIDQGKISGIFVKTLALKAGGKTHYLQFGKKYLEDLEEDLLSKIPTLRR